MKKAIIFSLFLTAVIFVGSQIYMKPSLAEGSGCTAEIGWGGINVSVPPGGSATETWSVSGADRVYGWCTGREGHDISASGQYTFNNIQSATTCRVTGYVNDIATCSDEATVSITDSGGTPPPPPQSTAGSEFCYFDKPGGTGMNFGPAAHYTAEVNPDICGGLDGSLLGGPYCAGDIGWKALTSSAWNATGLSSAAGYTATLNGGSFHNEDVSLGGEVRVNRSELVQENTYSLTVRKNGAVVTSCSVKINAGANAPQPPPVQSATPGKFPDPGTYSVPGGSGNVQVAYNYAPPMPGILLGAGGEGILSRENFATYMGQYNKNLFFAIGHWPGAVGKWNLSDPFKPAAPDISFIGHVPGDGGNGPLIAWWHAVVFGGATVAEAPDGGAVMVDRHGLNMFGPGQCLKTIIDPKTGYPIVVDNSAVACRIIPQGIAAMPFPQNGKSSFGQQIKSDEGYRIDGWSMTGFGTPDGNFFVYGLSASSIKIFNVTDLTGDAMEPYLGSSGSIAWANAKEIHITSIPDRATQFIIARIGTDKPTYKIGELSTVNGRLKRSADISFEAQQAEGRYFGDNIQSATVNGSTYIFVAEKPIVIQKTGSTFVSSAGQAVVGVYKLNPANMTVARKGSLTVDSALSWVKGNTPNYKVISSAEGDAYPVLLTSVKKPNGPYYLDDKGLNVYSTKKVLTEGGDLSPAPDLNLPTIPFSSIIKAGDIAVGAWPFQGLIKSEGGKAYLYAYRNAFQFTGVMPFDSMFKGDAMQSYNAGVYGLASFYGNPTLRIDKVEITNLTGTPGTVTPPPGTTPPPDTTTPPSPPPPPPANTGNECVDKYQNYCDQIKQLKEQLCKLLPGSSWCNP